MKKFYILLFFFFSFTLVSIAQQAPQYSMYMLNKYSFNPAYAGLDNSLSVTGVFRKQWSGLALSPTSQNVNAHMPIYFLSGGLGINLENDAVGAERNASASISYNYRMLVSKTSSLSIGLAAGVIQKSLDGTILRAPQGIYSEPNNTINHNDDFLPIGIESAIAPLFNAGIYFHNDKFEIGLASSNIAEPTADIEGTTNVAKITYVRNYFVNLATSLELGRNIILQPSILMKSDLIETQVEISTIVRYNDNIFGGASFRGYNSNSFDAVVLLAGYKLSENMTLAYSYDITLSGLSEVSRGSHEIMLNYNLNKNIGKGKLPKIIYNPRYL